MSLGRYIVEEIDDWPMRLVDWGRYTGDVKPPRFSKYTGEGANEAVGKIVAAIVGMSPDERAILAAAVNRFNVPQKVGPVGFGGVARQKSPSGTRGVFVDRNAINQSLARRGDKAAQWPASVAGASEAGARSYSGPQPQLAYKEFTSPVRLALAARDAGPATTMILADRARGIPFLTSAKGRKLRTPKAAAEAGAFLAPQELLKAKRKAKELLGDIWSHPDRARLENEIVSLAKELRDGGFSIEEAFESAVELVAGGL